MTVARLAAAGGTPTLQQGSERAWPQIGSLERDAIARVLERGVLWGPNEEEVTCLEREWAAYVGTRHCLVLNSGTAALHCSLVAAGVRAGDEVVVPAFGFVATPMAVIHAGATPVFCDVDPVSGNVTAGYVETVLSERTRAIVVVHTHGLPADMDALGRLAGRRGLVLIEDAAQAHGSTYRGKKVGSLGDGAAFSLNGSKHLSAGEGGLYVTQDDDAIVAARRLAIFGEDTPPLRRDQFRAYWSHGVGWNYRAHELTAALARAGLERLDAVVERAQRNARILDAGIASLTGLLPPPSPADRTCVFYRYRIRIDRDAIGFPGPALELRDRILWALRAEGVSASLWQLRPLPAQPIFRASRAAAWQPGTTKELRAWDPGVHPNAVHLLESSFVLGTGTHPLWVQPSSVVQGYVEALHKLVANLDRVLSVPYRPVQPWPPHT